MSSDLQERLQEVLGSAYRVDRELGGGGMSRVFVATDTELDRQVVVKVLPPDLAAGLNADRFRREIQTLTYSVFTAVANVWSTPVPSAPVESPPLAQVTRGNQTIETAYVSPDGEWLAYDSNINGNQDIFKMPVAGGEPQQLTLNMGDNFNPTWSPDGKEIAFHSLVKGNRDVYVMDASGGHLRAVVSTSREEAAPYFQPDGKGLFYLVASDSIFEIRRHPQDPAMWGTPKFMRKSGLIIPSPDNSKWVFSADNREACPDCPLGLYVSSSDGNNLRRVQLSQMPKVVASFGTVMWSRDSRFLFVSVRETDGTSAIWQVPLDGNPERRLVRLPDLERQFYRVTLSMGPTDFYFPVGSRQSDIWTMELKQ